MTTDETVEPTRRELFRLGAGAAVAAAVIAFLSPLGFFALMARYAGSEAPRR